jgi:hypothetical protein
MSLGSSSVTTIRQAEGLMGHCETFGSGRDGQRSQGTGRVGDLSGFGRDAIERVGPELDCLVVGQSRRVDHPGRGEVLGECLKGDAGWQSWGASEHLDES